MSDALWIFAHPEDCRIFRSNGKAVLYDCDGDPLFTVIESWSDDQIWAALNIANVAFRRGAKVGEEHKKRQLLDALGIQ